MKQGRPLLNRELASLPNDSLVWVVYTRDGRKKMDEAYKIHRQDNGSYALYCPTKNYDPRHPGEYFENNYSSDPNDQAGRDVHEGMMLFHVNLKNSTEIEKFRLSQECINGLLELLKVTDDNKLRDSTAILLADLREVRAIPIIAQLLCDPRTENYRGTLLYALNEFEDDSMIDPHFDLIKELTESKNYEVRCESSEILDRLLLYRASK